MPELTTDERDALWRQYNVHIDLYKFHVEATLKFNLFYYAVTGALVGYHAGNQHVYWGKWALVLPAVMSICFAFVLSASIPAIERRRAEMVSIRDRLGLQSVPEIRLLAYLMAGQAISHACLVIGLLALLITGGIR
ncbi:MAG TPA: hypothetical protein VD866_04020 [Urbifossiella sp.]|nr:hypothetical protein [Urbifossiella sp.]